LAWSAALNGFSFAAVLLALQLAGCSTMPVDGPSAHDIAAAARGDAESSLHYALVPVTRDVVGALSRATPRLAGAFVDRSGPRGFRFGIGDIVSVTIFESAAGGLFTSDAGIRAGNYITVPNQAVDDRGNIAVPYAGEVPVRGHTPSEVQKEIANRLKARALEPQAVVSLVEQRTSLFSVLGDVHNAGRFPSNPSGERVLDAIARAGGPVSQGYDLWVALERNGRRSSAPFGALLYQPSNNIFVLPNDVIYLFNEPQTFVAFGAVGIQGLYKFDGWRLSLAEALAKQGGLSDAQADPASVFVYRGETKEFAREIGVDVGKYEGRIVPVIYQLNLRDPSGYLLARDFPMRNKDVIFTANASAVEATKFLAFVRTILATVNDPIIYATNGYALAAAANGTNVTTIVNPVTPITTTK